jgi:hypothetical protein
MSASCKGIAGIGCFGVMMDVWRLSAVQWSRLARAPKLGTYVP